MRYQLQLDDGDALSVKSAFFYFAKFRLIVKMYKDTSLAKPFEVAFGQEARSTN